MIARLDIIDNLLDSLERDALTQEQMLAYCEEHRHILNSNIEQALPRHKVKTVSEAIAACLDWYAADKEAILANHAAFSRAAGEVTERIVQTYGHDIPNVVLVPCIGLYANGGWAQQAEDRSYVCVALERLPPGGPLDALLTHEIAHGIAETHWNVVLDGFYDEGHATYVSSVLCPGYPEAVYYMMAGREWLPRYLDWIDDNRDRILEDAGKPLQVLNDEHKFYFTSSYNPDTPNIGYVIGTLYVRYLHQRHSLHELRTFGKQDDLNRESFAAFLSEWTWDGRV